MSLSSKELDKLISIIDKKNKPMPIITPQVLLSVFGVCVSFFCLTIYNSIQSNSLLIQTLSSDILKIQGTQDHRKALLDELIVFTREPRFKKEDAKLMLDTIVNPINYKIDLFNQQFNSHGEWVGKTEKRVTELERNFNHIKEDLDEIKLLIKSKR